MMNNTRFLAAACSISAILGPLAAIRAQIVCVECYDQNTPVNTGFTNLVLNGSFENTNCLPYTQQWMVFCPAATNYICDIDNWTCTGGGPSTYALMYDATVAPIPDGNLGAYLGSAFPLGCSAVPDDSSCFQSEGCVMSPFPPGYPDSGIGYGGTGGCSLEQTVTGLSVGAYYTLEFWMGGESFSTPGVFAVDIGFGKTYLRCKPTPVGAIGTRYVIGFLADSTAHTVRFTNWGHVHSSASEFVLDDVRLFASSAQPCEPLAVEDTHAGSTARVFPSVFSESITVRVETNDAWVLALYDSRGKLVRQHRASATDIVDLGDLASGHYTYSLNVGGASTSGALIKE